MLRGLSVIKLDWRFCTREAAYKRSVERVRGRVGRRTEGEGSSVGGDAQGVGSVCCAFEGDVDTWSVGLDVGAEREENGGDGEGLHVDVLGDARRLVRKRCFDILVE